MNTFSQGAGKRPGETWPQNNWMLTTRSISIKKCARKVILKKSKIFLANAHITKSEKIAKFGFLGYPENTLNINEDD